MSALDEAVAIINAAARRKARRADPYLIESGMLSVLDVRRSEDTTTTLRCRFDYEGSEGSSSLQFTLSASLADHVLHARETSGRLFPHVRVVLYLMAGRQWDVQYLKVLGT